MFVRTKRSVQGGRTYEYLQLVEGYREGNKVRQRVLYNFGPKAELIASGGLDAIVRSLASFSERLRILEGAPGFEAQSARSWGPALVFRRLWDEQGLPDVIDELASERRFEFDLERAVFALALQRLCEPGSDRQGEAWLKTVECPGFDVLRLHHLYRAVGFLGSVRDPLELALFRRDNPDPDVVDLLFVDTTSTYICRDEPTPLRLRGYSRDRHPELVQVVLCVAVDSEGWPVAWDIHPGNTADKSAFISLIHKMRERFGVRRCIVVADRGMISKETCSLLEKDRRKPFDFILGCRMRSQNEVRDDVLARAGRYSKVDENLEVKEVFVKDRRYVICRNPHEALADAEKRSAVVSKLETTLAQGPKSLIANKGYARFLKGTKGAWVIDQEAIETDARLDGKFVLRTTTDLSTAEVAQAYKDLWRVERAFRETKSTLDVRPIYHHNDETTVGHIAGCFLALRLEVDLQRRLANDGATSPWPDLIRELVEVRAIDLAEHQRRFRLCTPIGELARRAFAAAGVRVPPRITQVDPS